MILSPPPPPLSQQIQFVSESSMSSSLCMAMRAASPLPPPLIPISSQRSPRFTTVSSPSFQSRKLHFRRLAVVNNQKVDRSREAEEKGEAEELFLYSVAPLPLVALAALPGADFLRSLFGPFVELVKSWNLPEWLVQWGHPGNMAVVLFAMGGYGTYLGFRIRYSDNPEEKAKAKDLHPKLLGGMFFFFALGATGGITSLLTQDKPIFESPHAVTALIGLALLTVQSVLTALFEENPGLRNVHGILGSSIMGLFLIHAALGLQLGLAS